MQNWTQEPWEVSEWYPTLGCHIDARTYAPAFESRGVGAECLGNRDRIIACVNAMAGIKDPAAFVAAAWEAGVTV
jgi:hypothetical protein